MTYALAGIAICQLIAFVVVLRVILDGHASDRAAWHSKESELLVRIQAPDTPQVTFLPTEGVPERPAKLYRTEADEIADAVAKADALIAQA